MMQSLRRRIAIGLLAAWALAAPAAAQSTGDIDGTRLTHLVDVDGAAQASVTITGTFSGTITFKVQHRNRAPVVVDCFTPAAPTTAVNSTTGTGSWSCPVAGFHFLEVQFSSYSSGTATILADTSNSGPAVVGGAGGGGSFDGLLLDAAGGDPITDTTNDALRVNCAVGCSAATSDADDASIAAGQTNSNSNALNQVYDGSVWRRLTIGTAGTPSAQVLTVQGVTSMTPLLVTASATNLDVQIGGSDTVTVAPASGSFASDVVFGTATYTEATTTGPITGGIRNDSLDSLANTTNEAGPLGLNERGALYTQPTAGANGGADALSYISAGSTEDEHAVKATAGTLYSITVTNTNAAVRYLKCENDTAANTAPGTDTPELRMAIPGATTGAGVTTSFPMGWSFSTALTCWLVTGAADSDVAEVAANEIMVFYTFR